VRGSDQAMWGLYREWLVSIHAPVRGSDREGVPSYRRMAVFQSTLPCEGATKVGETKYDGENVSIHAPVRGSDVRPPDDRCPLRGFNPRSRARERLLATKNDRGFTRFQSTLPCEGATPGGAQLLSIYQVSIHAPVRGSDGPCPRCRRRNRRCFNPRSRARERPFWLTP